MIDDERGLALGLAALALALIAGAILIWIIQLAGNPILDYAANSTNNATANTATGWFRSYLTFIPAIFMVLGLFGTIVYAVYTRSVQ